MVSSDLCTPTSTPSMYFRSRLSMIFTSGSSSAQKSKLTCRACPSEDAIVIVISALPQSEVNQRSVPVWLNIVVPRKSMVTFTSCFSLPEEMTQKVCLPPVSNTSETAGSCSVSSRRREAAATRRVARRRGRGVIFIQMQCERTCRICIDPNLISHNISQFLPQPESSMSFQCSTPGRMEAEEEEMPRSSCSIDQNPHTLSNKNVYSEQRSEYSRGEDKREKSMKYIGDRFFPVRKMPCSAKDLFNDHTEWMEDEENEAESPKRSEKRGMTVRDVYKMEVLGDGSAFRDHDISTFSNENFLRFSYKEEFRSENDPRNFHNGLLQFPEDHLPVKKQKDRKISKIPAKVLDAPALYDDFYLNLVDWSSTNLLAVGLSNSVYLWNAGNSKVVRLVELPPSDLVTSTCSSPSSNVLGVGTHSGEVQLWDCVKHKKLLTCKGHTARVGAISWNTNNLFASGSRDKNILVRDIRTQDDFVNKMVGHKQEVCGLKWSFDQQQLASGGNDNRLNIWSLHSSTPTFNLLRHTAAVKALAWSPHQHGLLVSGGGTADRTIRFWNSITGEETKCLNVGSQVCNLMFARTVNELVSTHGYSLNEINIWKMPKMEKLETLTGHTYRVLYLAMNPDGTTIVTGAGDETLRFWNIFPKKEKEAKEKSSLNTESICLR